MKRWVAAWGGVQAHRPAASRGRNPFGMASRMRADRALGPQRCASKLPRGRGGGRRPVGQRPWRAASGRHAGRGPRIVGRTASDGEAGAPLIGGRGVPRPGQKGLQTGRGRDRLPWPRSGPYRRGGAGGHRAGLPSQLRDLPVWVRRALAGGAEPRADPPRPVQPGSGGDPPRRTGQRPAGRVGAARQVTARQVSGGRARRHDGSAGRTRRKTGHSRNPETRAAPRRRAHRVRQRSDTPGRVGACPTARRNLRW